MRWLSGKSKSGETTHFVPNEIKRDTSDNPITFAHGLDIDDDSNEFAEEMKNDFDISERMSKPDGSTDQSEYETARMIMEEADNIGESGISDEDKMIDLYNIYQNYEDVLSEKQRSILLEKISGIDKMIRLKDKNNKVANNIQNKIQSILYRDENQKKETHSEPRESKSSKDDSKSEPKHSSEKSESKLLKGYDDDWYERSAMINAMAES